MSFYEQNCKTFNLLWGLKGSGGGSVLMLICKHYKLSRVNGVEGAMGKWKKVNWMFYSYFNMSL